MFARWFPGVIAGKGVELSSVIEEALVEPIAADRPCGENLEDTVALAAVDAFRVFGQSAPLREFGQAKDRSEPTWPDWKQVRAKAGEALVKSKDLRALAHLGASLLRTDGLLPFLHTLDVAGQWFERYPADLYPLVDGDGILRRSALNCFADPFAIVDALRRQPIVISRVHGTVSLRDVEIANGVLPLPKGEVAPEKDRVTAAFADMAVDDLVQEHEAVVAALAALRRIEVATLEASGSESVPSFDPLATALARMESLLKAERTRRGHDHVEKADAPPESAPQEAATPQGPIMVGSTITTRQDALRALEAVSAYFQQYEPSSPVPLILDRAKRLVAKSFLEVLADIAPDAVAQAQIVGGVKSGQ